MQHKGPVSVLVAPLDWGLGHATRCIPIIRELINQGARVSIAASGPQKSLLKQEFPDLDFHDLPGYEISYLTGYFSEMGPDFPDSCHSETYPKRKPVAKQICCKIQSIDAVISDNRYGLYHREFLMRFSDSSTVYSIGHGILLLTGYY